jgi:ArsR family transcriptional regulator
VPAVKGRTLALLEAKSAIFKALGHPTRLYIVERLARREHCVCEFVDAIRADFSTVSKHLAVLKQAGIVADDKRGLQVFYRLKMPCIVRGFGCIDAALQQQLAERQELLGDR